MGTKRFRITKVCDFCKRRKIKCNLEKPCATCLKFNRECIYSEKDYYENSDPIQDHSQNELFRLKSKLKFLENAIAKEKPQDLNLPIDIFQMMGNNPIESSVETYSFFKNTMSTLNEDPIIKRNTGPLSWISLLQNDNAMKHVWHHIGRLKDKFKKEAFKPQTPNDEDFSKRLENEGDKIYTKPYRDRKLSPEAKSLGIQYFDALEEEMKLVEKIKLVLPTQKVIWLLIERFFTTLYPFYPILDETDFTTYIEKLIGQKVTTSDHTDVQVNVEKKLDLAYLGILLIVLRLSYVSLLTSYDCPNYDYIKQHPISIKMVDVAQNCLDQFEYIKTSNIILLQLALFIRLYNLVGPEQGEELTGGDAEVANSMLVKMAMSLNLHREPHVDNKYTNLGRKIWYIILMRDLDSVLTCGTALNVNSEFFDTKIPYHSTNNANVMDPELESTACIVFPMLNPSYSNLYEIQEMIYKIRQNVNLFEFSKKLNITDELFIETAGDSINLEHTNLSFQEAVKLKLFLRGCGWHISILDHLFNYYERNEKYALYYLRKLFSIINCIIPLYHKFICKGGLQSPVDLFLVPSFETVAHKALNVLISFNLRMRIDMFESSGLHYESLVKCADLMMQYSLIFKDGLAKLSQRYYYAWRIVKAHDMINKITTDEFLLNINNKLMSIPTDTLIELESVMQTFLDNKEKLSFAIIFGDAALTEQIDNIWVQMNNLNTSI